MPVLLRPVNNFQGQVIRNASEGKYNTVNNSSSGEVNLQKCLLERDHVRKGPIYCSPPLLTVALSHAMGAGGVLTTEQPVSNVYISIHTTREML